MQGDLTTLGNVRAWLSGQTALSTDNDDTLRRLIGVASVLITGLLGGRQLGITSYDEWYDSGGLNFISLKQYPIRSVESIQFGGFEVTQEATGNPPVNGYLISRPTRLEVRGHCFPRGRSTVRVQYTAGYSTEAEAQTIPAMGAYTVTTNLVWLDDLGVTLANGTVLTKVASSPGALQYSVSEGTYTFNVAQAAASVLISYSSVPPDLEQAAIEIVGECFKHMDRIGLTSKNLPNGETIAYLNQAMSPRVRLIIDQYKNQGAW